MVSIQYYLQNVEFLPSFKYLNNFNIHIYAICSKWLAKY